MPHPANLYSLVADVGGTNTRVALSDGRALVEGTVRRYLNVDFSGLETVLRQYIKDEGGVDTKAVCVAVAGPVHNGVATMTNLDWTIDRESLAHATKAETVSILNDLQAQGHALGHLPSDKVLAVLPGRAAGPDTTKLVIGIGTGFNAAPVFDTSAGRIVPPSESGHANLPIRTKQDLQLSEFVSNDHGFPGIEDVLSGRGLENVYRFLDNESGNQKSMSAKEIMQASMEKSDPRAIEAARIFTRILGTVAGNLSLVQLPFGGVYLVGGVARAFAPVLSAFGFGEAFRDKGRFSDFMDNFPVHVVEDDYAALTGCAAHLVDIDA